MTEFDHRFPALGGRVAVVAGSSKGIGAAIAIELGRQRCDVVLTARDQDALNGVARTIERGGQRALVLAGDLRNPDFPETLTEETMAAFGKVDLLVNSAGSTSRADFLTFTDQDWADGFGLKFFGAMRLCRAFWLHLSRSKGAIINIAGGGGRTPEKTFTIGSSVNAAFIAFTKALADQGLADGVRVNVVNPGHIRTDRYEIRIANAMKKKGIDRAAAERHAKEDARITHVADPSEIASIVAFMLSGSGKLFHGAVIDADAGFTKGL